MFLSTSLAGFMPQREVFRDDYQYQLFLSWIQRGRYNPNSPASLSQYLFRITYYDRLNNRNVIIECDLQNRRIVTLRESIDPQLISTNAPEVELEYRYYLEMILFRLNSEQSFFVNDLLNDIPVEISYFQRDGQRVNLFEQQTESGHFVWERINFRKNSDGIYGYEITLFSGESFNLMFSDPALLPDPDHLAVLKNYLPAEFLQARKEKGAGGFSSAEEELSPISAADAQVYSAYHYEPSPVVSGKEAVREAPFSARERLPDPALPLKEYLAMSRENKWSREMLHNKIADPEKFLTQEFPYHSLSRSADLYSLTTAPFKENITGNVNLTKRSFRDGISFESNEGYVINSDKTVELTTGDLISLSELDNLEMAAISPYLSQLITMHRTIGTQLLNFLLIPADVPTTLILRDSERWVSEFSSYTDIVLMLSHYWQNRVVYFGIERVKKVNNNIELSGFLAAVKPDNEGFDFAEVRFALNSSYRIDLAMITLYPDVSGEDD
jgi:hypothetical protein